jgi:hypothetical protein
MKLILLVITWGLALPNSGQAFTRSHANQQSDSSALFWCTHKIPFVINEKGSRDAGPEFFEAVKQSFQAWADPECTDLEFQYRGTVASHLVGIDYSNLIVVRESFCEQVVPSGDVCRRDGGCKNKYNCWEDSDGIIALTTTSFNAKTGEIVDADIEMNGAQFVFSTVDAPFCSTPFPRPANCVATDVRNVMTHEVGHLLGLDHSPYPSATMYWQADNLELNKRSLDSDDILGICFLFPPGKTASQCSQSERSGRQVIGGCQQASSPPVMVVLGVIWTWWGFYRSLRRRNSAVSV